MPALPGLVIIGARGHGREVAQLVRDINRVTAAHRLVGFLDDDATLHGRVIHGTPVLGPVDALESGALTGHGVHAWALGIGQPIVKARVVERLRPMDLETPSFVHPAAVVGHAVTVGPGSMIAAGTVCTCDVTIGRFVTVNVGCTISHDAVLDDFATLAPGVHLAGNVSIGRGADIGIGTSVIQGIGIGAGTIVGAGAAVIVALPPAVTAVGVPARIIKSHLPGGPFADSSSPS